MNASSVVGRVSRIWTVLGGVYRAAVTMGRWVVVAGWVAAATVVTLAVPSNAGSGSDFGDLLPSDAPVLQVEEHILDTFRVPVLSGTTVVLHQPGGLSLLTRADATLWALATTQDALKADRPIPPDRLIAAIPVPTSRHDLAVTYLYVSPGTGLWGTVLLANQYAAHFNNQPSASAYVTGFVPAQIAQGGYLDARLHLFEIASVILIIVVVALAFRSLLAPLAVVGIAAIGYLVYFPLLTTLAGALGFEVPSQLEPVLVALLLGVVTDYCVLFFSAFRDELVHGHTKIESAQHALARDSKVVAVAGLTVAGGTIALLAAPFGIFRGLGPALALTVLVGLAICLTLTPAVMTILGWRLFTVLPVRGSPAPGGLAVEGRRSRSGRAIRLLTRRRPAAVAAVGVVLLLGLAAWPLTHARLDLSFTAALPRDDAVAEGADLLSLSGLRGISAPTEILVEQPGIAAHRAALARLQTDISRQPGITKVFGPADLPTTKAEGLVLAQSGDAARYIIVYGTDPLGATAISQARQLQAHATALVAEAGLPDARVSLTGQTLIASEVVELTRRSLQVTVLVALLIELVILILYLRAVLAPLALLACSALSVAAALGLTAFVFQDLLGQEGLTFYAPFAAAVLLIALGADYTVFSVGSIWGEARRRPMREALMIAVPRSSRAITTAGVILAATFAMVAIIPLATFRQIAFAMTAGLLIDTLVVRPLLTPAVLTLLGRSAGWPSRRVPYRGDPPTTVGADD
ncbi:MMPL family transporter [Microlunatus ginsengisoli]|uniref:MMPL family transporter n=1 Tax=Microlunatus ginsengisoli TaxID=363863 RepID=A0ABP6ZF29_9ACTN